MNGDRLEIIELRLKLFRYS